MHKGTVLKHLTFTLAFVITIVALMAPGKPLAAPLAGPPIPSEIDPSPPEQTAKLVFVHASVGEAWLGVSLAAGGNRVPEGISLMENNYFVSDYNVHNHPELPGHDYCAWKDIFGDPSWMNVLLNHNAIEGNYDRLVDPGGQNDVIMIKPCFIQYPIYGDPNDPPGGTCPPEGAGWTVSQVKQAMLDTLSYLEQYPNTFFVLVTAPPRCHPSSDQCGGSYDPTYDGENARAVANWMVNELLDDYDAGNVMVFDLYSALTSSPEGEGDVCVEDRWTSDLDEDDGNHHRIWNAQIQHQVGYDQNYSAYCKGHPLPGGLIKATQEFVPLLNTYYNAWTNGEEQIRADFTADPRSGLAPLMVQFTDTSTGDPMAWSWDFGDASPVSSQQHPSHAYTAPGSHTITLSIQETGGDSDTETKANYITVTNVFQQVYLPVILKTLDQ